LIRQALGHRSINSTMQYVGTSDGQAAEAAQAALMNLYYYRVQQNVLLRLVEAGTRD
jgi:hypothetical protein